MGPFPLAVRGLLSLLALCGALVAEEVSTSLVLDARTKAPLAGVRVARYREDADESFTVAVLLAEAATDAAGRVSIPLGTFAGDCHWVFDKPGYAVCESYGILADPAVELGPGQEVRGRLLDPFGRPCAGVDVEAFLGCGHSPAVRRARTDAMGAFVFEDLAPTPAQLWFVAAGLASTYFDLREESPTTVLADPGVVVEGRVVDRRGRPAEGAVVRSVQQFRGPRTVAARDGRFRLVGVVPGEGLNAWGPDGTVACLSGDDWEPGTEIRIRLGTHNDAHRGRTDPGAEDLEVRVRVTDAQGGRPPAGVRVTLLRPGDGRAFRGETGERGEAEVRAPAGEYDLSAGGPFASHVAGPVRVRVGAEGDLLAIAAARQPALEVDATGLPEDASVSLALATALLPLGAEDGWRAHLPAHDPAAVRVDVDGEVRVFAVGPAVDGVRRVRIR